jgi:cell division protein FtsN
LQVVLLAAVLIGLSRLAGRTERPAGGGGEPRQQIDARAPAPPADVMSGAPPDLTFYRTLGKERQTPSGDRSGAAPVPDEASGRPRDPGGAPSGAFIVQALATRDATAAKRLRDRLAGRGFSAIVTEDRSGGQPVYRVRVGRYRARAEAEAAARVLRDKDHLSPWILQEGE